MAKALKKARSAIEKRKSGGKDTAKESDTQPLESSFSLASILLAAIILIFLGGGAYAAYEMVLKGSGG
jgi:hypothetical protein